MSRTKQQAAFEPPAVSHHQRFWLLMKKKMNGTGTAEEYLELEELTGKDARFKYISLTLLELWSKRLNKLLDPMINQDHL